ncbi:hypothetical protein [Tenacibaculum sp. 190524A05c]|uniref:hypothetical protein n=1 Tax=Tenacibaculum platacis TaxID=3137852 RepID=UPI0031FA791F
MFKDLGLQEKFYVFYIYLIVLGIVSDAIFYGIIGIQYLNYVSILDALISPFSLLTNSWKLTLFLSIMFYLVYLYTTKWSFQLHKRNRTKKWYKKLYNVEKWDKLYKDIEDKKDVVSTMLVLFFVLFISLRLGMGIGTNIKIKEQRLQPDYNLVFKDNSIKKIRLIGQNSSFIFYVENQEKIVSVTPLSDNIKQIKRIPQED